ncbi:Glutathione-regulated potassium-efflux system protein KefC [Methyloligella halotolerans]|uniref:Glutathione-regulated potassium-efflux system protein KefC n=1 Tax=Methyloligella halotolerans TaxID=1177755 RepID=A0A1E2RZN7_9HYPH|nr:monovalent cation:proton antiporter-2 (CPA2) family protein [Methyloligella halotolerans]ODA67620.1 Glutathione-regulated potassium-efflux system protein KefC [Methyloligella halotolerans]
MHGEELLKLAVFLAAAAFAAPLGRWLQISSVLGYLIAGVLIGPFGLGLIYSLYDVENILSFAELGVVMLLFLIGLELRPIRLWSMRSAIFGLGGMQLLATAILLGVGAVLFQLDINQAIFIGLALSLSSTAFAIQILNEKGEMTSRHGRLGFTVLLFQDLAAIPLIALVPVFAVGMGEGSKMDLQAAALAIGTIVGVVVVGRFVLARVFRLVAITDVPEAMTATALLTVVGVALVMEEAGLSAALGAFIAGALLADSEYRHQIEADIAPFEGLLMGLFFLAIGMTVNFSILLDQPILILGLAGGLIAIKAAVLYLLGRWWGLSNGPAVRLGLVLSQGGEFGFVLFQAGVAERVIDTPLGNLLTLAVTLSMAATPLLLRLDDMIRGYFKEEAPDYETPPEADGHVIVAGFGRFGQIVARVLRARHIPFTALDISVTQVDFVRRFGSNIYYGDAARLDILRAAQADKARAFVLAIDDVEASVRVAETVRQNFPDLPIYARARNRTHVHQLMELGITDIQRETFLSALELTRGVLGGLGLSPREVKRLTDTFKAHDERRLYDDRQYWSDVEKMRANVMSSAKELEELFAQDIQDLADQGEFTDDQRDGKEPAGRSRMDA